MNKSSFDYVIYTPTNPNPQNLNTFRTSLYWILITLKYYCTHCYGYSHFSCRIDWMWVICMMFITSNGVVPFIPGTLLLVANSKKSYDIIGYLYHCITYHHSLILAERERMWQFLIWWHQTNQTVTKHVRIQHITMLQSFWNNHVALQEFINVNLAAESPRFLTMDLHGFL